MEIIVVGGRGSGKTTVLNRIRELFDGETAPFGKEYVFSEITPDSCKAAKDRLERLGLRRDTTDSNSPLKAADFSQPMTTEEYTGGSSSYYMITIANPTTLTDPYDAECNDIIEALQMNYAEGNAFKAIWRRCAARLGKQKKGYDNGLYDAEKIKFFGERLIEQSKNCKKESN